MSIVNSFSQLIVQYGLNLLYALIIFAIGYWLAGVVSRLVKKALSRTGINETLIPFAANLAYIAVLVVAGLAALERLGVQTTSIIAILGAAGLAVGLALQGSLANFAAGVLILVFKPFTLGNLIEAAGVFGVVEQIQIFNTVLLTPDNKTVIVPNAQITGGSITNYSEKGFLRLDLVFGIGYDDDLLKAKSILEELVHADPRVLKEPAPTVAVLELADSSVNFAVRPFVKVEDYWGVHFDLTEAVKLRFDNEGISIPYPQQDVHMHQIAA
ncbi:MAG: mechanosensitive ion channel family protein [Chloroflexi bacterium]|nr:MAG: mechanosensitive ion channel family protein [Chloroflexota bacterium]